MKKLIALLTLFVYAFNFSGTAWAVHYTRYVDAGAATGGDGSITTPFKTLAQVNTFISTTMTISDTADIYFQYGDTFIHTSASTNGIQIRKSHITLDAYGTASDGKPLITGSGSYPSSSGYYLIAVGNAGQEVVSNVIIRNLEIGNTLPTGYGGGVQFNGRTSGGNTYAGYGLIEDCYIHDCGGPAVSLWYIDNSAGDSSTAVAVNNNTITACGTRINGIPGSPQTIDTCNAYSYNNICTNNLIYDSYREGIGACGFSLVDGNIVINPTGVGIYYSDYSSPYSICRDNLIFRDINNANAAALADGIRIAYEGTNPSNNSVTIDIYNNVIIGMSYHGIYFKGWNGSIWGRIWVFNNTIIDNLDGNFGVTYSPWFSDVDIFNNTSTVFDTNNSAHFDNVSNNTSYTTWLWGIDHFYGDGIGASNISPYFTVATDKTGNPTFGKTSAWRSLTSTPLVSDYSCRNGSALIDQGNFPVTYTGKTGNTLTGLNVTGCFREGDTVWSNTKVSSVIAVIDRVNNTISLSNASSFPSSGSLSVREWFGTAVDIGAKEYIPKKNVFN